jgi:hypothetical protein
MVIFKSLHDWLVSNWFISQLINFSIFISEFLRWLNFVKILIYLIIDFKFTWSDIYEWTMCTGYILIVLKLIDHIV